MKVKIKLAPGAILPEYQTEGSAGFDLHSNMERGIGLLPGQRALISTGLFMAIPEGYELQIRPRSGIALKKGLTVLNTPGTIDSDYRGEIGVILINTGVENVIIMPKDRIAQGILKQVEHADFQIVEELNETNRGGGFGSTGR